MDCACRGVVSGKESKEGAGGNGGRGGGERVEGRLDGQFGLVAICGLVVGYAIG